MGNLYTLLGYAILLVWGTTFVFMRELLTTSKANVFLVVFLFNLIAGAAAFVFGFCRGEHQRVKAVFVADRLLFVRLACFNGLYHVLMPLSTYFVLQVQYATIANYTWPMLLVYLSARYRGRRLGGRIVTGCLLGFSAVILVAMPGSLDVSGANITGIACALLGAVLWADYSARLDRSFDSIRAVFQGIAQMVSAFSVLAAGRIIAALKHVSFSMSFDFDLRGIFLLLHVSLVFSAFAYIAWIQVMVNHPRPEQFKISVYILPVFNVISATLWYRTSFNPVIWIALALVLTGIWISRHTGEDTAPQSV